MGKKILLIEDDDTISEVIGMYLEDQDYHVRIYREGTKIESIVKEFKPDILIIDYQLPGMNGLEIAKLARKILNKDFPIIMTAANKKYKEKALAAGINAYIDKPFDISELLRQVKKYL